MYGRLSQMKTSVVGAFAFQTDVCQWHGAVKMDMDGDGYSFEP